MALSRFVIWVTFWLSVSSFAYAKVTVIHETFDDQVVGSPPEGLQDMYRGPGPIQDAPTYTREEAAAKGVKIEVSEFGFRGKSVHFSDLSGSDRISALLHVYFPPTAKFMVEYYILTTNSDYEAAQHVVYTDWGKPDLTLIFGANNGYAGALPGYINLANVDGTWWYKRNLLPYKENTWYYVRRTLDSIANIGELHIAELDEYGNPTPNTVTLPVDANIQDQYFNHLIFTTSGGQKADVYVDEITFTDLTVTTVDIDIKPGSDPNSINLGSNGVVPVAILTTEDFDATTVDPESVILAGAGVALRGKGSKLLSHQEDVDGDGDVDMIVQVETENLNPDSFQDGYAILEGQTYGGDSIAGKDTINIVPIE